MGNRAPRDPATFILEREHADLFPCLGNVAYERSEQSTFADTWKATDDDKSGLKSSNQDIKRRESGRNYGFSRSRRDGFHFGDAFIAVVLDVFKFSLGYCYCAEPRRAIRP